MTLRNQIGLDGDKTPPQYMAEVKAREPAPKERTLLDWGWLRIERRMHQRYGGLETHVTLTIRPWRKLVYSINYDNNVWARGAIFVAFGRVPVSSTGWHARGAIIPVDIIQPNYAKWATPAHRDEEDMFRKWT